MPKKPSDTVGLTLRLKESLRADLERSAKERGASLNSEVVRRLERSFERRDPIVDGVAIGGELYKTASEIISISRKINYTLRSSFLPGFIDARSECTEVKTRLDSLQGEVISIGADLDQPIERLFKVLQTILPGDLGHTVVKQGDNVTIVSRTTKDEDQ